MWQSRSNYIKWAVPVVFVLGLAAIGVGLSLASSTGSPGGVHLSGAEAAEIQLHPLWESGDLGGDFTEVSLQDLLDGRPIVMNFFSSMCQPCIREMPELQAAYERSHGDVQFLGVAYMDTEGRSRELVEYTGVTYDTYSDRAGDSLAFFDAIGLPVTAFIAPSGDVETVHIGALTEDDIHEQLVDLFDYE